MKTTQAPVLVLGTRDYATLVFPTEPHDVNGDYLTCWDRFSGHSACSQEWVKEQATLDTYWGQQELDEYVKRYDLDAADYVLVTKVERWHTTARRKNAHAYAKAVAA